MAMKKRAVKKPTQKDDTVIYQAAIGLGVSFILFMMLFMIDDYYSRAGYVHSIRAFTGVAAVVVAVLAAALLCGSLALRRRSGFWRRYGLALTLLLLAVSAGFVILHYTWVTYISLLYVGLAAITVLYLIALLYQHEFFLLSVVNVCAGGVFYLLSRRYTSTGFSYSFSVLLLNLFLVAILAAGCGMVFAAARKGGTARILGRTLRLSCGNISATLFYVTCAVWAVCLIASALLGSVFAYYSVFAVAAFELAAAVFYTVKLS